MRLIRSNLDLDGRALVMGILNLTPDSFSDGGRYDDPERAVERALEMQEQGADLIDLGGESTRPGARSISVEEEAARVLPVLARLGGRLRIPLSIDTTKSRVARKAIELGVEIINDVSGLRVDETLADVAAESGAALILMHSRGTPANMQQLPPISDLFPEVLGGLAESIRQAESRGVALEKIMVDPGIGFGKTPEQNLELIDRLDRLVEAFGLPVLLGTSRKSFIKLTLDRLLATERREAASERLIGTAASMVIGLLRGARIFRVHDVAETVALIRLTEAILATR